MKKEDQQKELKRLHNRYIARMMCELDEVNTPQVIKNAVKAQMSFYTNDIDKQVIMIEEGESKHGNKQE